MPEEAPDNWPRNRRGELKLFLSDRQADDFIKAGLLTEDDIVRVKPIPSEPKR